VSNMTIRERHIGRPGPIGSSALLSAPTVVSASTGIQSAAAHEAPSDNGGPHAAAGAEAKAVTSVETWSGSLALQAATHAAPLVGMYNLPPTGAFGSKAKAHRQWYPLVRRQASDLRL
jgi:hypothetical protein